MKRFLTFILPLVFLVSCTSAPKQQNYPASMQLHMQAAKHWELMAKKFAEEVAQSLQERQGTLSKEYSLKGDFGHSIGANSSQPMFSGYYGPIYIDKRDMSPFGKAFRNMLITEFCNHDLEVVDSPENAYSVGWGCQKVYHHADRNSIFPGIPLFVGATIGYLIVGGDLDHKIPNCEVVISMSLHIDNKIILRKTGIKYINKKDMSHYSNLSHPVGGDHIDNSGKSSYKIVSK